MKAALIFLTPATLIAILVPTASWATMPMLTAEPRPATREACLKWAKEQDEEAYEMWGTMPSGKSSKKIAEQRLVLSCLGDDVPEIVFFYSNVKSGERYCRTHPKHQICKEFRQFYRNNPH